MNSDLYNYKKRKYQKKVASYMNGGVPSLSHTHSERYIDTLAHPNKGMNFIPISSILITDTFPPRNARQLVVFSKKIYTDFENLYTIHQTLPMFLIYGFPVNIRVKKGGNLAVTQDRHSIALSILPQADGYTLEIFDANGPFVPEDYLFDSYLLQVVNAVVDMLNKSSWFKTATDNSTLTTRQFENPNINFGAGHCDLLAITYVEGRAKYPDNDNRLLKNFQEFKGYSDKEKEKVVYHIQRSIEQNKSLIRKMVPDQYKVPLKKLD